MAPVATTIYYAGRDEPPRRFQPLRAGPLSPVLDGMDLRYIRFGEREILRRIDVAVRDQN